MSLRGQCFPARSNLHLGEDASRLRRNERTRNDIKTRKMRVRT